MMKDPQGCIQTRKFRIADLSRLHSIDQVCFDVGIAYTRSELLFYLRHSNSIARVAELNGTVVGFAVGRVDDETSAHVLTLDVVPEARRRRVGTRLMEVLHQEFRKSGVLLAVLEVDTSNDGALKFYRAFGYEIVETIRGYYKGCRDAHRMVCFMESPYHQVSPIPVRFP